VNLWIVGTVQKASTIKMSWYFATALEKITWSSVKLLSTDKLDINLTFSPIFVLAHNTVRIYVASLVATKRRNSELTLHSSTIKMSWYFAAALEKIISSSVIKEN
jgi:hypothetical protein